mmetsp:Transcript_21734/g.59387  ORF Transcript_21734/g.59387 Transcript_21734/m.59387 type:complete len:219 (+) Transcript_21734:385-1041(+)
MPAGSKGTSKSNNSLSPGCCCASRSKCAPFTPVWRTMRSNFMAVASTDAAYAPAPLAMSKRVADASAAMASMALCSGALKSGCSPQSTTRKPRIAYFSKRDSVDHSPRMPYFSGLAMTRRWATASRAQAVQHNRSPSKPKPVQSMSDVRRRCLVFEKGDMIICTLGSGLPRRPRRLSVIVQGVRRTMTSRRAPLAAVYSSFTRRAMRSLKASPDKPTT